MAHEHDRGLDSETPALREGLGLPASVVTMSAYQYLEVVNLSPTGAKLRGSPRPDIGKTAMFRLEGLQMLCKVVWAKGELCGVRFDEPIPPQRLADFRDAGTSVKLESGVAMSRRPANGPPRTSVAPRKSRLRAFSFCADGRTRGSHQ